MHKSLITAISSLAAIALLSISNVHAGNYPIQENGSLSVTPVPELSTWAMIATGFAGLGLVGRRRRTGRLAPSLG